jgi:cytochrome b
VESPSFHAAKNDRGVQQTTVDVNRPHDWYGFTVGSILAKRNIWGIPSTSVPARNPIKTNRP